MVLFEYEYRDTFLHKMNPLSKLIMITCLSLLATVYWDVRFILPITIVSFLIAWNAKVPISWIKLLVTLWVLSIWIRLSQAIFMAPEFFKVLSPEIVTKTVIEITPEGFPIIGHTALTYGSLYYLAAIISKAPVAWTIGLTVVYTTPLNDILEILRSLRVPPKLVFIVMAAWRFLPVMIRNIENVVKAQRLRGWKVKSRNPSKLVKQVLPFTKPFASQFAAAIDTISISAELRCFGVGKVSSIKRLKYSAYDKILIIILPIITVILWYLALVHYIGLI